MHLSARMALCFFLVLCFLAFCGIAPSQADERPAPVDWVNPYIGTGGSENGPEYGGTAPLVTTPFGMTNWTAQTRQNRISVGSYAYEDDAISGFIGTHQPAARGFMQARNLDGSWASPDDGWTEGDQWVYLFAALHDIPGTIALLGGDAEFNAKLDAHFAGGHNRHDNEPSHHYGYLYDFGGQPWKTQARVRQIARDSYSNRPTGVLGNEDCGQMSAWYIFTAMGFYPVNPVSKAYMIGSPLYSRATLNLPNGKTFTVSAANNSEDHPYIQSATLNGKRLDIPVVTHDQIEAGGELAFVMGPTPSRWASQWRRKSPR
jgi:putative alpha-1,2-mannosidase